MSLCVAKLGGSLAGSPLLGAWLDAFAAWRTPLIVVPGGGRFARDVRADQLREGFSDAEAHRRALRAMERFGAVLAGHSARFVPAALRGDIAGALEAGKIPVWLPSVMALAAPDIPASWDMTSDSLAAWLAGACGATRLLLLKSCDVAAPVSVRALAAQGIVDPLFAHFSARSGAAVYVAGPAALADAGAVVRQGGVPGVAVSRLDRGAKSCSSVKFKPIAIA